MNEQEVSPRRSDRHDPDLSQKTLRVPISGDTPIASIIDPLAKTGDLYETLADAKVLCVACGHRCKISAGGRGICQVRYNLDGKLYVPWGYVAALQCDPTEKKPFNHVFPGSDTLTFGMLGCDLHCPYCQNWNTSQALRDSEAGQPPELVSAAELAQMAVRNGARCVASSYNEPLISSEWGREVFMEAKKVGMTCMYVSNGNATREVLEYIRPYTDAYKIDLKTMSERNYRQLGAVLGHVLDGVRMVYAMGFWLEIVTLIIPGFNDSEAELRDAARFLKSISSDIPWHVTAFHKDYRMTEPDNTEAQGLIRAAEIGLEEGLRYVYAGNMPGRVGRYEHTFCPQCQKMLIERFGYIVLDYRIDAAGSCPDCGTKIAGIWPQSLDEVRLGTRADLYGRRPRRVWR